jgi:hypothetical protein
MFCYDDLTWDSTHKFEKQVSEKVEKWFETGEEAFQRFDFKTRRKAY